MRSLMMEEFVSAKPERCEDNCPQRQSVKKLPLPLYKYTHNVNEGKGV
jgi:hypothetical protein